jgi:CRISPR/Cas system CSM-associated protein Csm2 small subunit
MNLNEIKGNTAEEVLSRLDKVRYAVWAYKNSVNPSEELQEIFDIHMSKLNEDKENLNFWILKDRRVAKLYRRIQELLR